MLIYIVVFRDGDAYYRFLRTDGSDIVNHNTDQMLRPNKETGILEWVKYPTSAGGVPVLPGRRYICGATSTTIHQAEKIASRLVDAEDKLNKIKSEAEGMK